MTEWIGDQSLDVVSIDVSRSAVDVVVAGANEPPPVESLAIEMETELGRSVTVTVRWVAEAQFTSAEPG